jgi:phosphopantothenoylcysteine synthetase/decarboxylase
MHSCNTPIRPAILVTAGPTWVPLDAVRHISNLSSGATGLKIARELVRRGAEVTLLWGPGRAVPTPDDRAQIRVVEFVTFEDLHRELFGRLRTGGFAALIHAAAVADYAPVHEETGKLSSEAEERVIHLRRLPKLVDGVRDQAPGILLVKFKLEAGRTPEELTAIGLASLARSQADLLVANDAATFKGSHRPALILDPAGEVVRTETAAELAAQLSEIVLRRLEQPSDAGKASR